MKILHTLKKDYIRFLYGKNAGIYIAVLSPVLLIFSYIYSIALIIRRTLYTKGILKSKMIDARVISIGNMTLGGTGKTPFVEMLAATLLNNGAKPAIVSRGYKGRTREGVTVVSDGKKIFCSPLESGDEPYMLAKKLPCVPVVVGKNRYDAALKALNFDINTIIIDDGYQHMSLNKDMDVLLIDNNTFFGKGTVFPHGILREPLNAVKQADVIVFTKSKHKDLNSLDKGAVSMLDNIPCFWASFNPLGFKDLYSDRVEDTDWIKGKKVVAFCGIGSPDSFLNVLNGLNADVVHFKPFDDHWQYTEEEISSLAEKACELGAEIIITTEKDSVRTIHYLPLPVPLWAIQMKTDILNDKDSWNSIIAKP